MKCITADHTSTFTYGADGLRRSMTVDGNTTHFLLDGQSVAKELRDVNSNGTFYDQSGNIEPGESLATYLLGPRGPEYRRDDNTWADPSHPVLGHKARWYLYDGLGSVLGEVDEQGNIVDKYGNPTPLRVYDVYGFVRNSAGVGPTDTDHKFVGGLGHTSEDNTGLIYMRARYYDPSIGRFISEDPKQDGSNWYTYCENNPVNLIDPDGKLAVLVWLLGISVGIIWGITAHSVLYNEIEKDLMWAVDNLQPGESVRVGSKLRPGVYW